MKARQRLSRDMLVHPEDQAHAIAALYRCPWVVSAESARNRVTWILDDYDATAPVPKDDFASRHAAVETFLQRCISEHRLLDWPGT